ncbi:MAG: Cys-tRNA(Pro) deacylase [Bacilli bacterium]|jgi:Cys-tRNA(Pro)/Cys-tRNA(Cys) deacylase|nr:Cys-tRNA(Pro) deacylase [Bacilli bacterium]
MEKKTNAMRMLEQGKIPYEMKEYEYDLKDLSGVHMATVNDLPLDEVYKTIVLKGDKNGFLVCLLPSAEEIDLKKVAKLSGNKSVDLIPIPDLEKVTGYVRGGCSPIGMKRKFPTFAASSLKDKEKVYVSAGKRGFQLHLKSADLISFCQITLGEITL